MNANELIAEAVKQARSERQAELKELRDQVASLVDRVAQVESSLKGRQTSTKTSVPEHSHKGYLGKQHLDALNRDIQLLMANQRELAKAMPGKVELEKVE